MRVLRWVFLASLVSACTHGRATCPNPTRLDPLAPQLLFRSGFEPDTILDPGDEESGDIVGRDSSVPNGDWQADLEGNPYLGEFRIQYQGGSPSQRLAALEPDPQDPNNQVLAFRLFEPNVPAAHHGPKARIQANLYGNQGLSEFTLRLRLYLGEGFPEIQASDQKVSWLTLMEFWNDATWYGDLPFRVTVNLVKPSASPGSGLFFGMHGQVQEGDSWNSLWEGVAEDHPVPLATWMEIQLHLLEGDGDLGRFQLQLTLPGEDPIQLFDVQDSTLHPDTCDADGFRDINPFKLYTSADLVQALHDAGTHLAVLWDDFEISAGPPTP